MWRHRHHCENEDNVVQASVNLLQGVAVEEFRQSGQSVPGWAYVNALAHSPADKLTSSKTPPRFLHPSGWDAVVAYLATELMTIAHGQLDKISLMQRGDLVPLELDLLAGELPEPEPLVSSPSSSSTPSIEDAPATETLRVPRDELDEQKTVRANSRPRRYQRIPGKARPVDSVRSRPRPRAGLTVRRDDLTERPMRDRRQ
jgi:hypothetical protein